jgi:hypothetical protein
MLPVFHYKGNWSFFPFAFVVITFLGALRHTNTRSGLWNWRRENEKNKLSRCRHVVDSAAAKEEEEAETASAQMSSRVLEQCDQLLDPSLWA